MLDVTALDTCFWHTNMHTVSALLSICLGRFYSYPSGLLHWFWGEQPFWIWVHTLGGLAKKLLYNHINIKHDKQNAYFMGPTVIGRMLQKQVFSVVISSNIPRMLWDVITYPCPRCLPLAHKSSYIHLIIFSNSRVSMNLRNTAINTFFKIHTKQHLTQCGLVMPYDAGR